jgi:hypothetical protein
MQSVFSWAIAAACLFVAALFFFFRAIAKKSMHNIWYSLVLLLLAGVTGARAGWLFVKKSYHVIVSAATTTDIEVYENMFGKSGDCVQVYHSVQPVVPRIDCCTCLEFQTCVEELQRIIAQSSYKPTAEQMPPGTVPGWWRPDVLGSGAQSLSCHPDEDSYQLLVFNADSTHAFYCYSTD